MPENLDSAAVAAFYEAAYARTAIDEPNYSIITQFLLHRMGGITNPVHFDYVPNVPKNELPEESSLELLKLTDSEIAMSRVEVEDEGLVWQAYELLGQFQRALNNTDRSMIKHKITTVLDELKSKYDRLMEEGKSKQLPEYRRVIASISNLLDEATSHYDENSSTW